MSDEQMLSDLEFEQKITTMGDRGLMEFIARQAYGTNKRCEDHERRLIAVEKRHGPGVKMIIGIASTIGGFTAGLVYGLITIIKR